MRRALLAAAAGLALAAPSAQAAQLTVTNGFAVDTVAPDVQITAAPPPLGRSNDVSFSFTAGADVTFACRLDGGDFAACTSPQAYDDLADGAHTFTLRATDGVGDVTELPWLFAIDNQAPPAPHVLAPADGAALTSTPIAISGTVDEPGVAIVISEDGTVRGQVDSRADGTWGTPIDAADGTHAYDVTSVDAAGNASSATRVTVHVDATSPTAPEIASPADGSVQRSTTVTLSGRAEPGAMVEVFDGSDSRGTARADANGAWALSIPDVPEGVHAYSATATDAAQHTGPASAPRSVRVDRTPPPGPQVSGGPDGFTLVSPEPGALIACSLDGGAFAPCASGVSYPGLAPGEHVLVVRATDAAGNETSTEYRFTVAAATPQPTSTPRPTATPVATPSYRKTVVLRPQAGRTLVRRPGETAFAEIRSRTAVPVGTAVDVRQGAVIAIAATPASTETSKFSGGVFTVRQPGGTELALSETLRCGRTRRLTGDGAGEFRIRGRYATATGRGAKWTVEDSCTRTAVRVSRGVVAVRADRARKTLLLRSGRTYTARPKR